MVKKVLASGEPCRKCAQAEQMLKARGLWGRIDEVLVADEADPESIGMQLARKHRVELAPFFVWRDNDGERIFTSTLELVRALGAQPATGEARAGGSEAPAGAAHGDAAASAESAEALAGFAERCQAETPHDELPRALLGWALDRFGARCGIAFSGAEDVALIDMAARLGRPFSVFCLDTGRLHGATYRFIDRVRGHYGIEIQMLAPRAEPLEALVTRKGPFSFYQDGHKECCSIRKVEPLRRALAPLRAWVTGQRRDQSPSTRSDLALLELDGAFSRAGAPLIKLNPLAAWSSADVWRYLRENAVPYNELHDHGYISIGCEPCTRPARPGEHERAARWWWEADTQRECGLHLRAEPERAQS